MTQIEKHLVKLLVTVSITLASITTALAGEVTWEWKTIENSNEKACYCYDETGNLYINTITPDGYTVNDKGQWTIGEYVIKRDNYDTKRQEYLRLLNTRRATYGSEPLTYDKELERCAEIRAEEIAEYFSHTRPDGRDCFTLYKELGISTNGVAENILFGRQFESPMQATIGWENSPSHCETMMSKAYTKTGIGIYEKDGIYYWVQEFSSK